MTKTKKPVFTKEEASTPISKIAEIVVRIRTELDAQDEGLKLRQLEGTAKEHLWKMQEEKRRPSDDENQFVKDMVHATFKVDTKFLLHLTLRTLMVTLKASQKRNLTLTSVESLSFWYKHLQSF